MRFYSDLADWWPLFSAPSEYVEEAALYLDLFRSHGHIPARTLLDLGAGGGNLASHFHPHLELTLTDLHPEMLRISEQLNPTARHIAGDMRTLRLHQTFDRVLIHDAICYLTTLEDLDAALHTAFLHCRPGGAAFFVPDFLRETFTPGTEEGGCDDGDRSLRYLAWVHDPNPQDTVYTVDYAFLLREPSGEVRCVHDRHHEGLFSEKEWRAAIGRAGFFPQLVHLTHSELDEPISVWVGLTAPAPESQNPPDSTPAQ